jgi:rhodanese-related sulfurtransferase
MSKDEFIKIVAADQPEVPAYFPQSASKNLEGSKSLADLPKPQAFSSEEIANFDGVVIDLRLNKDYGASHIPNSINIGLGGQFASWAGTMIPIGTPIALVGETQEQIDEAFMRLARVGHDTVKGFSLIGDYKGETKSVEQIEVGKVKEILSDEVQFVDVRRPAEHSNGHAIQTINLPLDKLSKELDKLDPTKPTYVICQSGYRSSLATSILENAGFDKVYNVTGGTKAWMDAELDIEVSATACANSK